MIEAKAVTASTVFGGDEVTNVDVTTVWKLLAGKHCAMSDLVYFLFNNAVPRVQNI